MSEYLPKEVREGLSAAQNARQKSKSRMRVRVGSENFTILRHWDNGFALDVEDAPHLRGLVDLYDGTHHLSQCLIVAAEEAAGQMVYEFKRNTHAANAAPVDYVKDIDAPVALLKKG